jgi:hypothetical protein
MLLFFFVVAEDFIGLIQEIIQSDDNFLGRWHDFVAEAAFFDHKDNHVRALATHSRDTGK